MRIARKLVFSEKKVCKYRDSTIDIGFPGGPNGAARQGDFEVLRVSMRERSEDL